MKYALFSIFLMFITVYAEATPSRDKQVRKNIKFGMQAVFFAEKGKGDELADFMLDASKTVSKMDGCILYLVQQSLTDNSKVLVTELWESKEYHAASLANQTVRSIIMKAKPIIIGMDHNPAKYIGGHGL